MMVIDTFSVRKSFLFHKQSIAPLVVFRIIFGALMFFSALRFLSYGWVYDLYIAPKYFFPYYHFEWVKPLGEYGMYLLFVLLILSSLAIMLGFWYRLATVFYFLIFTYVELIDKTNYLNHYYFISCLAFLMCFLPAGRSFSLDTYRSPYLRKTHVEAWTIWVLRLQLAILYVFAGISKINVDWLFHAMPLRIWLPAQSHIPLLGELLSLPQTAYFFSWVGCIYDLMIVFLLSFRLTRLWGYISVIIFHVATWLLFPIGVFPWVMIFLTLIFFPINFHTKAIAMLSAFLSLRRQRFSTRALTERKRQSFVVMRRRLVLFLIGFFLTFHLLMPLRYLFYPGNLFWTEQGFRFSWRVMLIEKLGYATFYVSDVDSDGEVMIENSEYLSPQQEKMMATQPDMILQYAHIIAKDYKKKGMKAPKVRGEIYVTLNGSRSKLFVNPQVNLAKIEDGYSHKNWILSD